ncbi:tetratricopeptide repeat protein [Paenibacillus sp. FSL K6-2859]|uniref:tetratricopeptide repeat protein n=1 Tax=Paenibacillus sp. FSL K6-2859 TaxID=2921482 RepID=UPI0030F981D2
MLAVALRNEGKAEEARVMLLELYEQNSNDAELLYQLAWTHDVLGLEREAVPFYVKSLTLGLSSEQRVGALLGLGSTYRTLGEYENSKLILEQAVHEYPENKEFPVFLAMTLHNLGDHSLAMGILLKLLAETSADEGIRSYSKAISYYSDKLEQVWD